MKFSDRLKHAWNAFTSGEEDRIRFIDRGSSSSYRPDRPRFTRGNERSIVTSVYSRLALDAASVDIKHVKLDEAERFKEVIHSGLNECLNIEANKDQTGRAFLQDIVMSMFDEGVVAVVPIDTNIDPRNNNSISIESMRTARIVEWYPDYVKVECYNDRTGKKEQLMFPKKSVAIIENPYYSVMNEPNSTMQRLVHKLAILDAVDEQSGAGKLDLIIQFPYMIKSESRKSQAEERRRELEAQLAGSKYGVAYTDGTEKIIQLNRSLDNHLMTQIEYLTNLLYSQLGITQEILNGTATPEVMANYMSRTIEPIIGAITDEFTRKFLTKTARTQGQTIMMFKDPFKLIPVTQIAEIADKFTRNEILTSNEVRGLVGLKPVDSERANQLVNKNINQNKGDNSYMQQEQIPSTEESVGDVDGLS